MDIMGYSQFFHLIPVSQCTLRLGAETFMINLCPLRFSKSIIIINTDSSPNTHREALGGVCTSWKDICVF